MPHSDSISMSRLVGTSINRAGQVGQLTDAGVAAANTKQGLKDFVTSVVVHSDQQGFKERIKRSFDADDALTDVAIAPLTTVAGLTALTQEGSGTRLPLYGD